MWPYIKLPLTKSNHTTEHVARVNPNSHVDIHSCGLSYLPEGVLQKYKNLFSFFNIISIFSVIPNTITLQGCMCVCVSVHLYHTFLCFNLYGKNVPLRSSTQFNIPSTDTLHKSWLFKHYTIYLENNCTLKTAKSDCYKKNLLDGFTHVQTHFDTVLCMFRQWHRQPRHTVVAISEDLDSHAFVFL